MNGDVMMTGLVSAAALTALGLDIVLGVAVYRALKR